MKISVIERQLSELLPTLNLRPTLERAAAVGKLLVAARGQLAHGEFRPWLASVGLKKSSAANYMAVASANVQATGHLSVEQFLRAMRDAKIKSKIAERNERRLEARSRTGSIPANISLHHADCRKYEWPVGNIIATDPPWDDREAYEWLAQMAPRHLVEGGLLMVQCGQSEMDWVMPLFHELKYFWCLALVYVNPYTTISCGMIAPSWRPLLVFSKGSPKINERLADVYTVQAKVGPSLHHWQQPLPPWRHWLGKIAVPGQLVLDPFAGAGTIGMACIETGLKYVGTEIDRENYEVARGRLMGD